MSDMTMTISTPGRDPVTVNVDDLNQRLQALNDDYSEKGAVENLRECVATTSTKKSGKERTIIEVHELSRDVAEDLIERHHVHLQECNIVFLCTNKKLKGLGAKVQKANEYHKFFAIMGKPRSETHGYGDEGDTRESAEEIDFFVTISLPIWNELDNKKRTALVDHLLTRIEGEEKEDGSFTFKLRQPDVQEFSEVLSRNGAWTAELETFVEVAEATQH